MFAAPTFVSMTQRTGPVKSDAANDVPAGQTGLLPSDATKETAFLIYTSRLDQVVHEVPLTNPRLIELVDAGLLPDGTTRPIHLTSGGYALAALAQYYGDAYTAHLNSRLRVARKAFVEAYREHIARLETRVAQEVGYAREKIIEDLFGHYGSGFVVFDPAQGSLPTKIIFSAQLCLNDSEVTSFYPPAKPDGCERGRRVEAFSVHSLEFEPNHHNPRSRIRLSAGESIVIDTDVSKPAR